MLEEDEKYFEGKRFKRLLQRYETAMEQSGTIYMEPDELTDIAEYYAMKGRMDEANAAIELATSTHPDSVDPQVFLSRQQMFMGNMDEAHRICDAIIEQGDREVQFLHAELLLGDDDPQSAYDYLIDLYCRLPKEEEPDLFLYDSAALLYDYSYWEYAVDILEMMRKNYAPMERAERIYILALLELGRSEDVVPLAEQYLETHPYDIMIWVTKGEAHAAVGDLEQAYEDAQFAIAIDPKNPHAQVLVGNCSFHLGHYEETIDVFSEYLESFPEEGSARYLLSMAYGSLGRFQEAIDEALRIDMSSPSVNGMRDGIYMHLAITSAQLGNLQKALEYEELGEAEEQSIEVNFDLQRGYIHLFCDDIDNAMVHFRKGLQAMPPLQTAFDVPLQCIERDRINEAIQILTLMDELYATDVERERIAPMLAHCYYQAGNRVAFLTTFHRAIMQEPELTASVFHLDLPHTADKQELFRSACMQIFASLPPNAPEA